MSSTIYGPGHPMQSRKPDRPDQCREQFEEWWFDSGHPAMSMRTCAESAWNAAYSARQPEIDRLRERVYKLRKLLVEIRDCPDMRCEGCEEEINDALGGDK